MKLVWLRRDLRVTDNTALQAAVNSGESVSAIFIATPEQWRKQHLAPIQADLLVRRLAELKLELARINVDLLYHQLPTFTDSAEFLVQFAQRSGFAQILFNKEYEINEVKRDAYLQQLAVGLNIECTGYDCKCIQPPGSILNQQREFFKVFTPYKKAWLAKFSPPRISLSGLAKAHSPNTECEPYLFDAENSQFSYPRTSSSVWPADFESIRGRLREFCRNDVDEYHQQRDFPIQNQTSLLSPYLAIGAISARQCVARLYAESKMGVLSAGAQVWLSELIWREFYQHLLHFRPDLAKEKNFHPWADNLVWLNNPDWFERWKQGQTGYPIVDAAMRQLNQTGWMHNRLRMIVASFLTKDLHIDWRWGEAYFMSQLIDGDFAANNGGWQWCSSTGCDGQPYFRIFNPVTQGEKFDPNGEFVRSWLPELKNVPNKWIHEPWKWTSVSSLSYPAPIVDHKEQRALTLSIYKEAKDS